MCPAHHTQSIIQRPRSVLACANAADAVEVLAVGFFLTVYRTNSGAELTSVEKGESFVEERTLR